MRKVVLFIHTSLDGIVSGPNGELDWISYNDELEAYAHSMHDVMDAAIFGRVTFGMMRGYWPTVLENPSEQTPATLEHARWLHSATKIVVSRTLESVDWNNTLLIKNNIAEQINKLKEQPGKDMWMLGSPGLAKEFMRLDLIDEYRINVNPVVLGKGTALFTPLDQPLKMKLIETNCLKGGVVTLRYARDTA